MLTEVKDVQTSVKGESKLLERFVGYCSNLSKLLNAIARILRFMQGVKDGSLKRVGIDSGLLLDDLQKAEMALVRYEQRLRVIPHLLRLKPFLDEHGIYRVQGRLSKMSHL